MNPIGFLLICALAFLIGMMAGLLSKPMERNGAEPIILNGRTIDNNELERLNREYRNFLSYDGTEQN